MAVFFFVPARIVRKTTSIAEFGLVSEIMGQCPLHESNNTDCGPTFGENTFNQVFTWFDVIWSLEVIKKY